METYDTITDILEFINFKIDLIVWKLQESKSKTKN